MPKHCQKHSAKMKCRHWLTSYYRLHFVTLKDQFDNAKKDGNLLTEVEKLFKSLAKVYV